MIVVEEINKEVLAIFKMTEIITDQEIIADQATIVQIILGQDLIMDLITTVPITMDLDLITDQDPTTDLTTDPITTVPIMGQDQITDQDPTTGQAIQILKETAVHLKHN